MTGFVVYPSGMLASLTQFGTLFISSHINSHLGSKLPLYTLYRVN